MHECSQKHYMYVYNILLYPNLWGSSRSMLQCSYSLYTALTVSADANRFRGALSCTSLLLLLNPRFLSKSPTVFLLFLLLCLITDYHCHLLSSICYCANDEMNRFKQLNRNDYLLSLVTISQIEIKEAPLHLFLFFSWKSSNEHSERAPNFQSQPREGEKTKK